MPLQLRPALPLALLALAAGCAPTPPASRPAPAPAAATATAAPAKAEPKEQGKGAANTTGDAGAKAPSGPTEAPAAWHRLDYEKDSVYGTGVDRALRELLADRRPTRRVVVAVIDGGIDTMHPQLRPVLWKNEREVAGNGVDDDRNGYVDDIHGWSMIPTLPGDTGKYDTMERTRLYAACKGLPAGRGIAKPGDEECASLAADFAKSAGEFAQMAGQLQAIGGMYQRVTSTLRRALKTDTLTQAAVRAYAAANQEETQAKTMWLRMAEAGIDSSALAEARGQIVGSKFQLDTMFDPRALPHDARGSSDIQGPDAGHGTHVAGIIGAVAAADSKALGLANFVSIMGVRAVPDGDERDPDVARAIRYAVDNGAQVINMSFGKGYSPGKPAVDSAVAYAASKGVLLVHAAGNDGADNDSVPSFPTRRFAGGASAANWLEIGANSWRTGASLPAEFSNYGKEMVDLFAPGVDVLSTIPGGGTDENSGTSMAAPVVSGVAALLLSYFPGLTPIQVRQIILETARPVTGADVTQPGGDAKVPFASLSRTGGVIDAYAAVRKAIELSKPVP